MSVSLWTSLCDYPGVMVTETHSPTHTYPDHQSSIICYLHLLYCNTSHPPCTIYVHDSLCAQPLSKSSLVNLLVWHPPLHMPYISSPNLCLLFAIHAHSNGGCFAVVMRLYHPIRLSFNSLLGTRFITLTPHIHLTILIALH